MIPYTICIVVLLLQGQHHILLNKYTIRLDNFRRNTKNQLRNIRFIQSIRERRKRYVYSPMTRKSALVDIIIFNLYWF